MHASGRVSTTHILHAYPSNGESSQSPCIYDNTRVPRSPPELLCTKYNAAWRTSSPRKGKRKILGEIVGIENNITQRRQFGTWPEHLSDLNVTTKGERLGVFEVRDAKIRASEIARTSSCGEKAVYNKPKCTGGGGKLSSTEKWKRDLKALPLPQGAVCQG